MLTVGVNGTRLRPDAGRGAVPVGAKPVVNRMETELAETASRWGRSMRCLPRHAQEVWGSKKKTSWFSHVRQSGADWQNCGSGDRVDRNEIANDLGLSRVPDTGGGGPARA